jgi:ubiquinone/menaquinone biosynthesis C-methylase UbiE
MYCNLERDTSVLDKEGLIMTRYWDRVAGTTTLVERIPGAATAMTRFMLTTTGIGPGDTVLDLGCGTGSYLGPLRAAVGAEGRVVGVDASAGMMRRATRRVEEQGWDNVELVFRDATTADLGTERFDAAFALYSLSAMADFPRVIRRVHTALRPGGKLFVADVRLVPGGRTAPLVRLFRAAYRRLAKATGRDVAPAIREVFDTVELPDGREFHERDLPHWPPLLMLVATKSAEQAG